MSDAAARVLAALAPNRARFLAFARSRVGGDAEDVLQTALLRAALKADTLKESSRAVPWFFQILRHAVADHRPARETSSDEIDREAEPPPEATNDACRCSMGLLDSLRPEYAEILRRVDLDDQSLAECAAALSITENNAAVRLHRARKALREELVRFCGTDSIRACLACGCDA
jgi:RNA polymerase sigma-70 factor (ECF subfamily)